MASSFVEPSRVQRRVVRVVTAAGGFDYRTRSAAASSGANVLRSFSVDLRLRKRSSAVLHAVGGRAELAVEGRRRWPPAAVLSCGADVGWSGPSVGLATVDLSAVRCAMGARPRRARARRMVGYSVWTFLLAFLRAYAAFWTAPSCVCGKCGLCGPRVCRVTDAACFVSR